MFILLLDDVKCLKSNKFFPRKKNLFVFFVFHQKNCLNLEISSEETKKCRILFFPKCRFFCSTEIFCSFKKAKSTNFSFKKILIYRKYWRKTLPYYLILRKQHTTEKEVPDKTKKNET